LGPNLVGKIEQFKDFLSLVDKLHPLPVKIPDNAFLAFLFSPIKFR